MTEDTGEAAISTTAIEKFIHDALVSVGLPSADAAVVSTLMAEADLVGADAHGIFRLPQYVKRIIAGGIATNPSIRVRRTGPATALVDGDNAMGHLVMSRATETAISLAQENGIGWVGVHHSNHAGPASLYVSRAVDAGMVGIYSAVASANHMAMWGSNEALLGTNPLAIGIPGGAEAPLILDMATTVVSYGTVKNHALQDKPMPSGWMVRKDTGETLTDASLSSEGLLAPIGGYKGSGLALALGLLAGVMNGAAFGRDVVDFNADDTTTTNTGQFILALDISRFLPLDEFKEAFDHHIHAMRESTPIDEHSPVRVPGGDRLKRSTLRSTAGVPLSKQLLGRLDDLAMTLGIDQLHRDG